MEKKISIKKNTLFWYSAIVLYMCLLLFFGVSLYFYHPTDSSWFYITTEINSYVNKGGMIGAYSAALFFYLLGGAAFLVYIPLVFILYMIVCKKPVSLEWERLLASFVLVILGALFLSLYHIDIAVSPYPGGAIGVAIAQALLFYCDEIGTLLFLYCSLLATIILLSRWSGIIVAQYCMRFIVSFFICIKQCSVSFVTFIYSLYTGKEFHDAGLLYPEENTIPTHYDFSTLPLPQEKKEATMLIIAPVKISLKDKKKKKISRLQKPSVPQEIITASPRYVLPYKDIFIAEKYSSDSTNIHEQLQERAKILEDKLQRFGVQGSVTAIKRGPVVTLFEYQPDVDTKLSKIIALEDDLAMALQAMSIRIIAPIPGRSVVGFEVSNTIRQDVLFSDVIHQKEFTEFSGSLPIILGKGTIGQAVVVDLARMPHLLIAGSTGSGKSVALNATLISLLCARTPDELKLILIDPKRLEFAAFTDIAHLLFPIVTNPNQAAPVLKWVVQEMEERYEKMAQVGARNITDYNSMVSASVKISARKQTTANTNGAHNDTMNNEAPLPFIVVVIDELADLMITAGRDIEDLITRITQMARAAGIHMIVATQRPSVDVITGLIKANFPSRISFKVASRIDSRTILDTTGADRLLGRGDMLFLDATTSQLRRVHGAYVSDTEIEEVAHHIRQQRKVEYRDMNYKQDQSTLLEGDDELYKDVRFFLEEIDEISISLLQRKFRIGYNRSARLIDILESQGLIMPQDGSKTRKVIR